jgi:hypothetical protein
MSNAAFAVTEVGASPPLESMSAVMTVSRATSVAPSGGVETTTFGG